MGQNPQRVETAKAVNLLEYLEAQGVDLLREGSFYRLADEGHIVIDSIANRWYDNGADSRPRDIIDWCTQREGMSWGQAIAALVKFDGGTVPRSKSGNRLSSLGGGRLREVGPMIETQHLDRQGYAYLTRERGIPAPTVEEWVAAGLLATSADGHHNLVWTAYDESGQPIGQIVRGTLSQVKYTSYHGSKAWPVQRCIGSANRIIIFEAPIDAMAYEALYKPQNRLLAVMGGLMPIHAAKLMAGLSKPDKYLTVAVDNDEAGNKFWGRVSDAWPNARRIVPPDPLAKDWDEYLVRLGGAAPLMPEVKE